uniref:serine/arginine-rich splicing factor 3-like n=1 Tax=Ciona intestinalis TaxID=7719 RepID=UPI00006A4A36|nr:serine/arginine-rich splicing factor 3-like [Ciona intestinalis]XP_026689732.1 serine/arginine-rich splicing factor 3-like [Ciona intestinalis]|eukprot:XP_002119659.1 serine/arginine-rich splicing factor 3-like [Ciona intestinalis]
MSYRNSGPLDCKVYVGNLGSQGSKNELERVFGYYGALKNVWVARNPPGFAFVEFEDNRDAEDAVRALDGRTVCGVRARVEMSSGQSRRGNDRDRGPPRGRRDDYYDRNRRGRYDRSRSKSPRRHSRSRSRSPRRERRRNSYSRSPVTKDRGSQSPRRSVSPPRRSLSRSVSPYGNGRDSRSRSRS